jgi:hypothetical protein
MAENESLTQTIKDLTTKLNISKDEIIQLKTSMASSIHEELRAPTNLQPPTKIQQPSVLLIGTSNIEGIKADKLTTVANVQKNNSIHNERYKYLPANSSYSTNSTCTSLTEIFNFGVWSLIVCVKDSFSAILSFSCFFR